MRHALILSTLLLIVNAAEAQTDFSGLAAQPGDRVWVTSPSGTEVGGLITELTPSRLSIGDHHHFNAVEGLKIERAGDSLTNGIVIGAAIGALLGGTIAAEACLESSTANCVVGGA